MTIQYTIGKNLDFTNYFMEKIRDANLNNGHSIVLIDCQMLSYINTYISNLKTCVHKHLTSFTKYLLAARVSSGQSSKPN